MIFFSWLITISPMTRSPLSVASVLRGAARSCIAASSSAL
jgi:hypothetical protein